ncbi:MAG TPA: outer membrane beta-barrel protein, partial [Saprospiraceae bacterium]|nr:outer membrane beta-barrel protein [Saprospiraceae bacterium]
AITQNAGKSHQTGIELVLTREFSDQLTINLNANGYRNQIDAFTVTNEYPVPNTFSASEQKIISGNLKMNAALQFVNQTDLQITAVYLAPDIIPQGRIAARFSLDLGLKRGIQNGKGALFINATDLLNTMLISKEIEGNTFSIISSDYYETQTIRAGYQYKF